MTGTRQNQIMEFAKLCEKSNLHGLAFQHHAICQRRAWFHLNRLDYAHLEDRMKLGVLAHETSKVRDRSVYGLMGLSPDRIDWQNRVVIEAKAKGGVADAVSRQAIYYALILSAHTGKSWIPAVYVISERRTRKIQIREEVISEMLDAAKELTLLLEESCPKGINAPICRTCSYALLCGRV